MKVLHITTWYPNKKNPKEALWIKRHIDALEVNDVENEMWHIRTIEKQSLKFQREKNQSLFYWLISIPTDKWFVIEIITYLQLLVLGISKRKSIKQADIINFHIAYPSLTYWKWLKPLYKKPVVITEHWSAYHFNFGIKGKTFPRIERIFQQDIPLITVSEALKKDIESFSGSLQEGKVIPNVVDSEVFYFDKSSQKTSDITRFFMVSLWSSPKTPLETIRVFKEFNSKYPQSELIIAGYGDQVPLIKSFIIEQELTSSVQFLGILDSKEIAKKMNEVDAFIHISTYETFSVVCAEALSCGCPVIASKVGGIKELVSKENGVLVSTQQELLEAMIKLKDFKYNTEEIAKKSSHRFSKQIVGEQYKIYLQKLINTSES